MSKKRPEPIAPAPVTIRLYAPVLPPAVPDKVIGRATISLDLWEQIGGVGRHYDSGRRPDFHLRLREPLPALITMTSDISDMVMIETIWCEVVRLWRNGRDTYEWRAVVPSADDRAKLAAKVGVWRG